MKLSASIVASVVAVCLVAVCRAEPPVRGGYSTTSQDAFAPPSASAPSASYGAPPPPSSSYGPPQTSRHTAAVLRPSYVAPSSGGYRGSAGFGGTRFGGVSSQGFGSTGFGSGLSSQGFGSTGFGSGGSQGYSSGSGGHGGNRRPSSGYGAPSTGSGSYDEGNSEPANYQFSYHVQDSPSGNDFGHQESRQGHVAKGMYMVLLPDGRRQIVEYTADESGYHPIVRYEGTATTATGGGYPSASGNGGYRY